MKFALAVQTFAAVSTVDAYYKRRSLRSLRYANATAMMGAADASCPCISQFKIDTSSDPSFPTYHEVNYPANVGTSCKAWDKTSDPACGGSPAPGWCENKWCYVDPCTCGTMAKKSSYFPKLKTTSGHPVYYSYTTCKADDAFTCTSGDATKRACPCHKDEGSCGSGENCRWNAGKCIGAELLGCNGGASGMTVAPTEAPAALTGAGKANPECPCISQSKIDTSTQPNYPVYDNRVKYPANVGTSCKAWDSTADPSCSKSPAPGWCKQEWCYVDPCTCGTIAKKSSYFPKLLTTGKKPVYYSYTTCGVEEDAFTCSDGDVTQRACPCHKDESSCGNGENCKWNAGKCIGAELLGC